MVLVISSSVIHIGGSLASRGVRIDARVASEIRSLVKHRCPRTQTWQNAGIVIKKLLAELQYAVIVVLNANPRFVAMM